MRTETPEPKGKGSAISKDLTDVIFGNGDMQRLNSYFGARTCPAFGASREREDSLEAHGDMRPRYMVVHDKTRLTVRHGDPRRKLGIFAGEF